VKPLIDKASSFERDAEALSIMDDKEMLEDHYSRTRSRVRS